MSFGISESSTSLPLPASSSLPYLPISLSQATTDVGGGTDSIGTDSSTSFNFLRDTSQFDAINRHGAPIQEGANSPKALAERETAVQQAQFVAVAKELLTAFNGALQEALKEFSETLKAVKEQHVSPPISMLPTPDMVPISNSIQGLSNALGERLDQIKELAAAGNELATAGNKSLARAADTLEKANTPKPKGPARNCPDWIANIAESAARGLVNLVKDSPWAKDTLKGFCHTFETMSWLVSLGLSLSLVVPTIIYATVASLPTIGVSAIALVGLGLAGKHFMACLKYELNNAPSTPTLAPVAVKDTAAKVAA